MGRDEKDLRIQIPTQAWITSMALWDIDKTLKENPNISLHEYIDNQKHKTNIWEQNLDTTILNPGYLLMMAYAFLVVPKESIEKCNLNVSSPGIDSLIGKMAIKTNRLGKKLSRSENIIRHLRNSISHANYEIISESNELVFLDENRAGNITFKANMKIDDFKSLLVSFYKEYYSNYYNEFIAK